MEKLNKQEIIKEIQRMLLKNDYSVKCVYDLGKWMLENLETSREYINKPNFKDFLKKRIEIEELKSSKRRKKEDQKIEKSKRRVIKLIDNLSRR